MKYKRRSMGKIRGEARRKIWGEAGRKIKGDAMRKIKYWEKQGNTGRNTERSREKEMREDQGRSREKF